jgi:hypothetical protein
MGYICHKIIFTYKIPFMFMHCSWLIYYSPLRFTLAPAVIVEPCKLWHAWKFHANNWNYKYWTIQILIIFICSRPISKDAVTKKTDVTVTLYWTCIRDMPGSNLGRDTSYPDRRFCSLSQSSEKNVGILHRLGHDRSFKILSNSSFILLFDASRSMFLKLWSVDHWWSLALNLMIRSIT